MVARIPKPTIVEVRPSGHTRQVVRPSFELKSIEIHNFKSLREIKIDLRDLNVLVGSNAVGKSNILEVFRFLGDATSPEVINPFARYGGYKYVVWKGDEELPIAISLIWGQKSGKANELKYSITLTGYGGSLDILNEKIAYGKTIIEKDHNKLRIIDGGQKFDLDISRELETRLHPYSSLLNVRPFRLFRYRVRGSKIPEKRIDELGEGKIWEWDRIMQEIKDRISKMHVHNFNPRVMKTSSKFESVYRLNFEGDNFQTFLYNVFLREGQWKPEVMERLKQLFPNLERMYTAPTEDGRVMLKITESGLELIPNSISDGFYKILAILVLGTEIKNSMILIDEIENSIYPEAIEILVDVLRESSNKVIITTHSPIVLNMVDIEDILLLSKDVDETTISRVKEPKKMKKQLEEKGISLGEGWLYHILE